MFFPGPTANVATAGNDVLTGTGGADLICGLGGSDTITGLGGNDRLYGDACPATARGLPAGDLQRGGR